MSQANRSSIARRMYDNAGKLYEDAGKYLEACAADGLSISNAKEAFVQYRKDHGKVPAMIKLDGVKRRNPRYDSIRQAFIYVFKKTEDRAFDAQAPKVRKTAKVIVDRVLRTVKSEAQARKVIDALKAEYGIR